MTKYKITYTTIHTDTIEAKNLEEAKEKFKDKRGRYNTIQKTEYEEDGRTKGETNFLAH